MQFSDPQELARRARRREKQRQRELFWNLMTTLVLLVTVGLIGFFLVLYSNPQIGLNPFPPPTMPVLANVPTSTPTPPRLPPTWTPTLKPTETMRPSATAVADTPSPTMVSTSEFAPTFALTDTGEYPYQVQGLPAAMANTVFHPDESCEWQGVAGTVVDLQGKPVVGVLVRLTGVYHGRTMDMNTLSGGASAWYGESGYEFFLGSDPIATSNTLAVQLVDQALMPISPRVVFNTYEECNKNLILINFKQTR